MLSAVTASIGLHRALAVIAQPVLAKPIVAQQKRVRTAVAPRLGTILSSSSYCLALARTSLSVVLSVVTASIGLHRALAVIA